jgi:hypothetical protein
MASALAKLTAPLVESKSARKKKAKSTESTEAPKPPAPATETTPSNGATESANGDGTYESPYIKELYKYVSSRPIPSSLPLS